MLFLLLAFLFLSVSGNPLRLWPYPNSVTFGNNNITIDNYSVTLSLTTPCQDFEDSYKRFLSTTFMHKARLTQGNDIKKIIVEILEPNASLQYGVNESFYLNIPKDGNPVKISSQTVFGAYYALNTLSQLIEFDTSSETYKIMNVPIVIYDSPLYKHRGILLDTGSHYFPIKSLYKFIDSLAYNKINTFHWVISNKESQPLQSYDFPDAWNGAFSDYEKYTLMDVSSLVQYGAKRGVRLVPEFGLLNNAQPFCQLQDSLCPSSKCMSPIHPGSNITTFLIESILNEWTAVAASPTPSPTPSPTTTPKPHSSVFHFSNDEERKHYFYYINRDYFELYSKRIKTHKGGYYEHLWLYAYILESLDNPILRSRLAKANQKEWTQYCDRERYILEFIEEEKRASLDVEEYDDSDDHNNRDNEEYNDNKNTLSYESLETGYNGVFQDKYIHIGGSNVNTECWSEASIKKWLSDKHFTEQQGLFYLYNYTYQILKSNKRSPIIWDTLYNYLAANQIWSDVTVQTYADTDKVQNILNAGHNVIISNSELFSIDILQNIWSTIYKQDIIPTGLKESKGAILGAEAFLSTDFIDNSDFFSTLFPSLSAFAERLWTKTKATQVTELQYRLAYFTYYLHHRGIYSAPITSTNNRDAPFGPSSYF
ncbi:hypothetical protein WA158_002062 [Blastocystis sp. Blastoise]